MKYLVLLGDGMADWPLDELDGKSPLEYAHTPNMDVCAGHIKGMLKTVPESMPPGSDVANLSVLGYDVEKYYTGRAPLEAVAKNIYMSDGDVAYRCNFVRIENDIMKDFSAGHIKSEVGSKLIDLLNNYIEDDSVKFYAGVSYRNLMIWHNGKTDKTTPPHDTTDKNINKFLPQGESKIYLLEIMKKAREVLKDNKIYPYANAIWIWGEGKKPKIPNFESLCGKKGCIISAVDLMVGIGKLIGCYTPHVPNVTGFIDTNYKGKIDAALNFLEDYGNFVYVHVEATDEAGHMGDLNVKIKAIELFDKNIVGEALHNANYLNKPLRISVLPDHPTPIKIKTHTKEPVPFAIYDSRYSAKKDIYSELSCKEGIFIERGSLFLKKVFFID